MLSLLVILFYLLSSWDGVSISLCLITCFSLSCVQFLSLLSNCPSLSAFFSFTFPLYLCDSVFPSVFLSIPDSLALYFNLCLLFHFPFLSVSRSLCLSQSFIPCFTFLFLPSAWLFSFCLSFCTSLSLSLCSSHPKYGLKSSPAFTVYHSFPSVYKLIESDPRPPPTHTHTQMLIEKHPLHAYVFELASVACGNFHLNKCVVYGPISKMLPAQLITAECGGKLPEGSTHTHTSIAESPARQPVQLAVSTLHDGRIATECTTNLLETDTDIFKMGNSTVSSSS